MKNILLSIIIVSVSLIFVSCSENGLNDSENMNGTTEIMSSFGGGGFWNTPCDNETWDGVYTNPCYSPASNCVVVCAEKLNDSEYSNFVHNINVGNSADYYENGNGQTFLPLHTGPYNDLINGNKEIVKVPAGNHEYAIIDVVN